MKHGTRLVAGLSAVGLATAFLTGCGSKDPDQALCDDVTALVEAEGASNSQELDQKIGNDPAKLAEMSKGLREAAEKNKDSQYAKSIDLAGRIVEVAAKGAESADAGQVDQAILDELASLGKEAATSEMQQNRQEFSEKCPAFVTGTN